MTVDGARELPGASARPRRRRTIGAISLTALAGTAAVLVGVIGRGGATPAPPPLARGVPSALADLMGLSALPARAAPAFTLVDQHGRRVSLRSLRGRAVVLEFMDPHCVDVCPIVAQEFVDAYRDLGGTAARVDFVAVNVNPYHRAVSDVAAFTREHGLSAIPSWEFLTGPVRRLEAVWHGYDVYVHAPSRNADVIHTSIVYFIDPLGRERYVAAPQVDHTASGRAYLPPAPLAAWGRGIATVARDLAA
ncbi:MAG TPA: SCO family protein [Acidimicrobiales bacterium]|nr:SCO family protein [Acidimicrobiales bacterium]